MIIGNLTRDPELRTTPSGQNVCNFGVATSSQWTDASGQKQERVEYHNIVAWGRLAEICGQYLAKGRKVYVEGRLQTRDWEGQDGVKRSKTEIVTENMIMLSSPSGSVPPDRQAGTPATPPPSPTPAPSSVAPVMDQGTGDEEIRVEDIPF